MQGTRTKKYEQKQKENRNWKYIHSGVKWCKDIGDAEWNNKKTVGEEKKKKNSKKSFKNVRMITHALKKSYLESLPHMLLCKWLKIG